MLLFLSRWLLGLLFIAAGANHFFNAPFYVNIMPPYLPWHVELVYASGVFEIALGAMLLIPRYAPLASWGLIALLIAVFPANVHMAMHPDRYPRFSPALIYARLPLQGLLIAWACLYTRRKGATR